jgi:gluconate 2-dehydrogenase gamma chain
MERPGRDLGRRQFLETASVAVGTSWLATLWPVIQQTAKAAQRARSQAEVFVFFQPDEARAIEAVTANIIPDDETPGAKQAGVVYFIDRALTTFHQDQQRLYRKGLAALTDAARRRGRANFAELTAAEQIGALRRMEKGEFFKQVREHTIMGFLGNPEYGGNRDEVGWKLIGFEHAPVYRPPFGYYDQEPNGG